MRWPERGWQLLTVTLGPAAPPLLAPPGTLVTLRRALSFSLSVHPFKRKSMKPGPPCQPHSGPALLSCQRSSQIPAGQAQLQHTWVGDAESRPGRLARRPRCLVGGLRRCRAGLFERPEDSGIGVEGAEGALGKGRHLHLPSRGRKMGRNRWAGGGCTCRPQHAGGPRTSVLSKGASRD